MTITMHETSTQPIDLKAIRDTTQSTAQREQLSAIAEDLFTRATADILKLYRDVPGGLAYSLKIKLTVEECAATGLAIDKIVGALDARSCNVSVNTEGDILTLSVLHPNINFEPNGLALRESRNFLKEIQADMKAAVEASPFRAGYNIIRQLDHNTLSIAGLSAADLMVQYLESDTGVSAEIVRTDQGTFLNIGFGFWRDNKRMD